MDLQCCRIVLVGCGSIGQALIPLLILHLHLDPKKICVLTADEIGKDVARFYNIDFHVQSLNAENYESILAVNLQQGDLLINVSVGVSSLALVKWCNRHSVFYLDTCVEPWQGGYQNEEHLTSTTNCYLRNAIFNEHYSHNTTAIIAHGANPGLISHFVKAGLMQLAKVKGVYTWDSWAHLAELLGVKVIQIAELDTQTTHEDIPSDSFLNTWSSLGLISEGWQRAEAGWGSHEKMENKTSMLTSVGKTIYLNTHGAACLVKSWVPASGEIVSMLISHHEASSIADLLTLADTENNAPTYRPTVYFAYRPSPLARESIRRWRLNNFRLPKNLMLIRDTVESGFDQLGALFVFEGGSYWYGSTVTIEQARHLLPYNNATSIQVVAGILGALMWMQKNPEAGVVEAESMDADIILSAALPFLGEVAGFLTKWQPSLNGELLLEEFLISGL